MNSLRTLYGGSSDIHTLLCKHYELVNWFYKERTLSICRAWFNCFVFPHFLTLYHYSFVTTASLMTIIPHPRSKTSTRVNTISIPRFLWASCYTLVWYWSRYLHHTTSGIPFKLGTIIIPVRFHDVNTQWTCLTCCKKKKNKEFNSCGTSFFLN